MSLTEDTPSFGVDPLEAPPQDDNAGRIEHAPEEIKDNKETSTADNADGGDRLYLWLSILVAVVGAAIIVVVILVAGGDDDDSGAGRDTPFQREAFPPVAMVNDMQTQLNMIRTGLAVDEVTKPLLEVMPATVADLEVAFVSQDAHPAVKAAAWVVIEDEYNAENQIVERFALAMLYFETDGPNWTLKNNWMTNKSLCDDWHGVTCCGHFAIGTAALCHGKHPDHISFLDLTQNNLMGPFSVAFALLDDLHALLLSWNNLSGPADGAIVASMTSLQALALQHNRLSGPLDPEMVGNGALNTFYVQGNYFTGDWPEAYCVLDAYTYDCFRNDCKHDCCFQTSRMKACTYLSHTYDEEDQWVGEGN